MQCAVSEAGAHLQGLKEGLEELWHLRLTVCKETASVLQPQRTEFFIELDSESNLSKSGMQFFSAPTN